MHPTGKAGDGHVAQMDIGVAVSLDRNFVEILDFQCRRIRQHKPVDGLELDVPARQHQILPGNGLVDVVRGEVPGQEFLLIEIDHDLHILPSVGVRQDRAGDRDQKRADAHNREVIEFRRRQRL